MTDLSTFIVRPRTGLIHTPCGERVAYVDANPSLAYLERAAAAHRCTEDPR